MPAASLRVRHELERLPKQPWKLVEPKSAKSPRTIRLPAPVIPEPAGATRPALDRRLAAGDRWQHHGLVFTTRTGYPARRAEPESGYKSIDKGVQRVASRVVMEILGDSQISLKMNTCRHVIEQMQDEAAAD